MIWMIIYNLCLWISASMFLDVKQIIDFDVMIQKENLDDQEKNIKINDLKLRGNACGGEISSRIFHDQI